MLSAASFRTLAVGQQVHRLGLRQLAAAERETQLGDGLVEQAHPGGASRDRFLVQQLFEIIA
jgi:hypothetical protein